MRLCFKEPSLETSSFHISLCNFITCHSSNKVGSTLSSSGTSTRESDSCQNRVHDASAALRPHHNRSENIQYSRTKQCFEQGSLNERTQLALCCAMTEKPIKLTHSGNFMSRCKHDLTKKHTLKDTNSNDKPTMMDVGLQVGEEQLLSCEEGSCNNEVPLNSASAEMKESDVNFERSSALDESSNKEAQNNESSEVPYKSSQLIPKPGRPCLSHDKIVMFADEMSTSDTGNESSPHTPDHYVSPDSSFVSNHLSSEHHMNSECKIFCSLILLMSFFFRSKPKLLCIQVCRSQLDSVSFLNATLLIICCHHQYIHLQVQLTVCLRHLQGARSDPLHMKPCLEQEFGHCQLAVKPNLIKQKPIQIEEEEGKRVPAKTKGVHPQRI